MFNNRRIIINKGFSYNKMNTKQIFKIMFKETDTKNTHHIILGDKAVGKMQFMLLA